MNARAFEAVCAYALRRAGRAGAPVGLVCVAFAAPGAPAKGGPDPRPATEATLAVAAARISDATRGEDVLGRSGTWELSALVLDSSPEGTTELAGRIESALSDLEAPGTAGPGPARIGWASRHPSDGRAVALGELFAAARAPATKGGEKP